MTFFQKTIIAFLSILAVAVFALVFWLYSGAWNRPLGPSLQIPTTTPFRLAPTWTPESLPTESSIPALEPLAATPQAASPAPILLAATSTPVTGVCGGPPVMNILAIGSDVRGNNYNYGLADVIRLIRLDFVNPKVTVLEFPRDLWVEIPDIADNINGQTHEKLNQAYLYGNPGFGYTDDPAEGPGLLARTLTNNFGTNIDHYAAVNMRTFEKIVDAVGGIDIFLPNPVDGRTAEDTNKRLLFEEGLLHLNGTRALTLARIRIAGTFARADNQNRVLCALRDKLTRPEVISKVPQLIQSFQDAIQTRRISAPPNSDSSPVSARNWTQQTLSSPVFPKSTLQPRASMTRFSKGGYLSGMWTLTFSGITLHSSTTAHGPLRAEPRKTPAMRGSPSAHERDAPAPGSRSSQEIWT
jgi:LCP family protein required for cell wall assembly